MPWVKQILPVLTTHHLMVLTIGFCGLMSNKEIGEIVDASESTFLQEFIS